MRAGSICCSYTLALAIASYANALAHNATSPAPGPFEALTVGDARCVTAQKPEQQELPVSFTSTVEPVESPAVAVTPNTDTVIGEAPKIATTSIHFEPSLPVVTTRIESVQVHPELLEFPSFAEWKERHLAHAASAAVKEANSHTQRKRSNHSHDVRHPPAQAKSDAIASSQSQTDPAESTEDDTNSRLEFGESPEKGKEPHSIVPSTSYQRLVHPVPHAGTNDPILDPLVSLKDRTNYASFDCSATLIRSSKRTKSASAILSSKKDRYMLSPCSASEKFVIIELCDEIQIDTIVLANLEFFSSMFKLFRVRAGTSYPESTGTWQELGNFRATNVRGLQVFRPPEPTGGGFYRYLRIDFLSHYGTEHYCPVSILRVYGHNQLEAYRRDQERDARLVEAEEKLMDDGDLEVPIFSEIDTQPFFHLPTMHILAEEAGQATKLHHDVPQSLDSYASTSAADLPPTSAKSKSIPGTTAQASHQSSTYASTSILPAVTTATSSATTTLLNSTSFPAPVPPQTTTKLSDTALPSTESAPRDSPTATVNYNSSVTGTVNASRVISPSPTDTSGYQLQPSDGRDSKGESNVLPSDRTGASMESAPTITPHPTAVTTPPVGPSDVNPSTSASLSVLEAVTTAPGVKATSSPSTHSSTHSRSTTPSSATLGSNTATQIRAPTLQTVLPVLNRKNETRQPAPQVVYTHASNPHPNESIYGTIMKRLLALEFNTTLTTSYMEEHTRTVWSAFRRIEEKILNLEKTRSQQDQLLRRLMLDLELHRARIESERVELSAQISMLSREMVLEKRLGIAQLLALVILLFFVIFTRGSPTTPFVSLTSPPTTAALTFPRSARPRPRSVYDRPEGLARLSGDFSLPRDRRQVNQDRKSNLNGSALPLSRTTSIKKGSRSSGGFKRATSPTNALPLRLNTERITVFDSVPAVPSTTSTATFSEPIGTFRASSPLASVSTATASVASNTVLARAAPPVVPVQRSPTAADSSRSSPVEAIKRRLRLMQPRRAASLDGPASPLLPSPLPLTSTTTASPAPEKRKLFSLAPRMRRRSTVASTDADEEEGNSKAWLSTSEDSADDTSTRHASFSGLSTSLSQASIPFPPSPDPSDAEAPHVS